MSGANETQEAGKNESMRKVCAVVVTRDRGELLVRNIKSIRSQTMEADILVYDNASERPAADYLMAEGLDVEAAEEGDDIALLLPGRSLVVVRSETNTGGAGGFCAGMEYAWDAGYEYIWLMDDDGYCLNEKTLETLQGHISGRKALANSLVVCQPAEEGGDDLFSFSLLGERYMDRLPCEKGEIAGDVSTFNSTLLPRELIRQVGVVDPLFFIYGDDWDYLERAKAAGWEIFTAADSRYFHPDSGMGHRRIFGRLVGLRDMADENIYYYERNSIYIIKRYRGRRKAFLHGIKAAAKYLLYKKRKLGRMRAALVGMLDGWHDRMKSSLEQREETSFYGRDKK